MEMGKVTKLQGHSVDGKIHGNGEGIGKFMGWGGDSDGDNLLYRTLYSR